MLVATALSVWLRSSLPLVILAFISFCVFIYRSRDAWGILGKMGGPANLVTATRLLILLGMGLFYEAIPSVYLGGMGALALVLDGLDGYLARRYDCASDFGAYFDMETDAHYVLIFGFIIWASGLVGLWILIPGVLRYLYVPFVYFIKTEAQVEVKTPKRSRYNFAKIVAGTFMGGILFPFFLDKYLSIPTLLIISILIIISFGISFIQLFKNKIT